MLKQIGVINLSLWLLLLLLLFGISGLLLSGLPHLHILCFFLIFTCFLLVGYWCFFALVFEFSDCLSSFPSLHVVSLGWFFFCVPFCGPSPWLISLCWISESPTNGLFIAPSLSRLFSQQIKPWNFEWDLFCFWAFFLLTWNHSWVIRWGKGASQ